jgi:hypothetical protein
VAKCLDKPLNDVRQSFTPSLPKLVAVEVELVVANPGPSADTLTMRLVDPTGRPVAIVSKMVQTTDADHALFVFPEGGIEVSPGQLYSLQLSGGPTFGWKYVVGGYRKGSASFNGQALLRETRSTFLFRHSARRKPLFLSAHTSLAAFNPSS